MYRPWHQEQQCTTIERGALFIYETYKNTHFAYIIWFPELFTSVFSVFKLY